MKSKDKSGSALRALRIVFTIILAAAYISSSAQVFSNKVVGKKNEERIDSLKKSEYPFILPIWGAKAVEAGFDIPYSAGFSLNYLNQESSVLIENLNVGINNSPLYNLDDIIRFNDATARTEGLNFRPDFWLFPFLNIYGIFARSKTSTEVDLGVWLPGEAASEEIFRYQTKANFNATSVGFGLTPTIGIGGGWLALDMNFTWTDIPELEKPAYTFVFGPRMGKSFNLGSPQRSIAVWVGGFRANLRSDTKGALNLEEVLPTDDINAKIDNGLDKVDQKQGELDDWWNSLSPGEKVANKLRYEAASIALGKANDLLLNLSDAADNLGSSTIRYDLDKRLKDRWNFIVGSQLQINKHWMVRAELGFLGSRRQVITGLQYRFGL